MKKLVFHFLFTAIIISLAHQVLAQHPKEAVCAVCRMHEGTTEPEKVVAVSEYQGVTHYFCSKKCKETFDNDPEAYLPPVLPRPAPNFTLPTLAGEKISLESFHGKAVLLDFWATWCKPCVKSMPKLNYIHTKWNKIGLAVLGISTDEEKKKVKPFVERHKIAYPILLDAEERPAWEAYKVKVIPMMFLVDPKGQIVQQWVGETDMKEVENAIADLVGKSEKE